MSTGVKNFGDVVQVTGEPLLVQRDDFDELGRYGLHRMTRNNRAGRLIRHSECACAVQPVTEAIACRDCMYHQHSSRACPSRDTGGAPDLRVADKDRQFERRRAAHIEEARTQNQAEAGR
jgi:hypothetical protein